jgi:hypothetical protein
MGGDVMRALIIVIGLSLNVAACKSFPLSDPCGVIKDSLKDVRGATPDGDRRISVNYERGRAAGCWE